MFLRFFMFHHDIFVWVIVLNRGGFFLGPTYTAMSTVSLFVIVIFQIDLLEITEIYCFLLWELPQFSRAVHISYTANDF